MRLVIVESPFAPQTPLPEGSCANRDYGACVHCANLNIARVKRLEESKRNIEYARAALADCLHRGEAPYASHLLYTQPGVLDDTKPEERKLGMTAGFAWRKHADATIVYTDLGISAGMQAGVDDAKLSERKVEFRTLPGWK